MALQGIWGRTLGIGVIMAMMMAGCAAPNDTSTGGTAANGDIAISLTDKPGDFAGYTVQVSDLTLTHENGAVVHTIAHPVAVDFAQYVQVSEFLTLLPVRLGHYKKVTMTLDYAQANIQVEDNTGKPLQVAADKIVDAKGEKITTLTVDVELEGPTALTIAPGLLHHLHLDFDLAATNKVSFDSAGVPTVTVEPALIAEVNPHQFKEHRLRGLLATVDAANHTFTLEMRPFMAALAHAKAALHGREDRKLFGDLTVQTTDQTKFTINGQDFDAAHGLDELNKMARPARVVVKGMPKFNPFRIEASDVDARTLDQNADHAVLEGTVLKRTGNTLVVRGAVEDKDGDVHVAQDVTVNLVDSGANKTEVKAWRPRLTDPATIQDISVGQHIHVAGALSADNKALDAAKAHLQATVVAGNVKTAPVNGIVVLNVARIDGVAIGAFDFAGTGNAADRSKDAKGDAYTVKVGALAGDNFKVDAPVRVVGKPVPFGMADTYVFDAAVAIDFSGVPVFAEMSWKTPAANTLSVSTANDMVTPNLGADDKFALSQGGIKLTAAAAPSIKGVAGPGAVYIIMQPTNNAVFQNFTDFAAELAKRLAANAKVKDLRAIGAYDATANQIAATWVRVQLMKTP